MLEALERSAMRKIYLRLLPFAILTYLLCYIDRINVSFAALTMRGDLGMSAQAFGFAAGTFYWGYFIAEVPSNIILEKVGARIWVARIMITWGLLSAATAYVSEISAWLKAIPFLAPVAGYIDPTSTFAGLRFREHYLKRLASAQRDRRGMRQAPSSNVKSPQLTSSKPFALPERSTENR